MWIKKVLPSLEPDSKRYKASKPRNSVSFRFFFSTVLVSLLMIGLSTCDIGIGSQVDIARPTAELESHSAGDFLTGTVLLTGTAADDTGIASIQISFDNGITYRPIPSDRLTLRGKTAEWSYELDTTTKPDGPLPVLVQATDLSGRSIQTTTMVFQVDNNPPVVLVTSPFDLAAATKKRNTRVILTIESSDVHQVVRYGIDIWGSNAPPGEPGGDSFSRLSGYPKEVNFTGSPFVYQFNSLAHTLNSDGYNNEPIRDFRVGVWAEDLAGNRSTYFYHVDDTASLIPGVSAVQLRLAEAGQMDGFTSGQMDQLVASRQEIANNSDFLLEFDELEDLPVISLRSQINTTNQSPVVVAFADDDGIDQATAQIRINRIDNFDPVDQTGDSVLLTNSGVEGWVPFNSFVQENGLRLLVGSFDLAGLSGAAGRLRIEVRVKDSKGMSYGYGEGARGEPFTRDILVDAGVPQVTLNAPGSVYFSDYLQISGSAVYPAGLDDLEILIHPGSNENLPLASWAFRASMKANLDTTTNQWTFDSSNLTGEALSDFQGLPDGNLLVLVRAVAGTVDGRRSLFLTRDRIAPSGQFIEPLDSAVLNQIAPITGFTDDSLSGVAGVAFYFEQAASAGATLVVSDSISLDSNSWIPFESGESGPGYSFGGSQTNYIVNLDTEYFHNEDTNRVFAIHKRITDRAGNHTYRVRQFTINQASDLPTLSFINVNPSNDRYSNILSGVPARIIGRATDDDGFLDGSNVLRPDSIQYRVRTITSGGSVGSWSIWKNVDDPTPSGSTVLDFSIPLVHPYTSTALGDGIHDVQIWVEDRNGLGLTRGNKNTDGVIIPLAIDNGPPILNFIAPTPSGGSFVPGNFTVQVAVTDAVGIALVTMNLTGPSGTTTRTLLEPAERVTNDQPLTLINVSDLNLLSGSYTLSVTAQDLSGSSASINRNFILDRILPTVGINEPLANQEVNGIVTIRGSAGDNERVDGIRYWIGLSGTTPPVNPLDWSNDGVTGTFNWQFNWDTRSVADQNDYRIHVRSVDPAGNWSNTASVDVRVDQTSDIPRVTFTDLDATVSEADQAGIGGINLLDFNARVRGVITDDDLVDASSIQIRINSDSEGDWQSLTGPIGPNSKSVSFQHNLDLPEGIHYFYLRFSDLSSAKQGLPVAQATIGPVYFAIDTAPPVITVTSPGVGSLQNTGFTLTGTATDSNGLKEFDFVGPIGTKPRIRIRLPHHSNWGEAISVPVQEDGTWQYDLDPTSPLFNGSEDGNKTLLIRASDRFDKETTFPFNVIIDTQAPTLSITSPVVDQWIGGSSASVAGSANDSNGISQVRFWVGNSGISPPNEPGFASWTLATGSSSWSGSLNIADLVNTLGEGPKVLHVVARDNAGNWSEAVQRTFGIDLSPPVLQETALGQAIVARSDIFTLAGTAQDSNQVSTIRITQQRGTDAQVELSIQNLSGTNQAWELNGLPRNPAEPDNTQLSDGVYLYTITLTDLAGKQTTLERTVTVDLTGPLVTINQPLNNTNLNGTNFVASGTAVDTENVSAINQVRYWVSPGGATPPASYTNWMAANGTSTWQATLDLDFLGEGLRTLRAVARDAAGNWSEEVQAVNFMIDQNPPTITETLVGSGPGTIFRNQAFSLAGNASDSNQLDRVEIRQNGTLIGTLPLTASGGSSESWTLGGLPRDPSNLTQTLLDNGIYNYVITVFDIAGKSVSLTRAVTLDTQPPVGSLTLTSEALPGPGSQNTVNGVLRFSDNASDPNGLVGVRWWILPATEPAPNYSTLGFTDYGSAPYTGHFNTTTLADGDYVLWSIAQDSAGNNRIVSRELLVDQSSDSPMVSFNLPTNTIFGVDEFDITGSVSDLDGLSSLQWRLGGTLEWNPIANWSGPYPTNYNWSISLSGVPDGLNRTIEVRAVDRLNETSFADTTQSSPSFSVLTQSPLVTIDTPAAGALFNGTQTVALQGTTTVDSPATITGLEYQLGTLGSWVDIFSLYNSATSTYSVVIPTESLTSILDGILRIRVRATGSNGKKTTETLEVRLDREPPTVAINLPPGGATVNGLLHVSGTATDNNTLDRVRLEVIRNSNSQIVLTYPDLGRFNWSTQTQDPAIPIDTRDLVDGQYYILRATAFDGAGNSASIDRTIQVDQSSDTPSLSFSNFTPTQTLDSATIFQTNGSIIGTATDDDGVSRVEYRFNNLGDWQVINLGGGLSENFSVNYSSLPDGPHQVQFRVVDVVGFTAGILVSPQYQFRIDRESPAVTITEPAADTFQASGFSLTGTTSDLNGVTGVSVRIAGGVFAPVDSFTPSTDESLTNWTTSVPYTGPDGFATVEIRATDLAGRTTTVSRQFRFDTTPPTLAITSQPMIDGSPSVVNRDITITGTVTDSLSGVNRVEVFAVPFNEGQGGAPEPMLLGQSLEGITPWTMNVDTTRVSQFGGDLFGFGQETTPGSGIWDLTIRARAYDNAGNTQTVDRIIRIDQTTNRPNLSFSNLETDGSTLYTSFTNILGVATDDDGVASFEYRFNGYESDPWTQVARSGGLSEQVSIPLTGLVDGPHTLEVRVQDTLEGLESSATFGPYEFRIDTLPPSLTILSPNPNSFRNQNIQVQASATDANGIKEVRARIGTSGPWIPAILDPVLTGIYNLTLPLDGLSQGVHTIYVEAEDDSATPGKVTQVSRTFTYDTNLPELSILNPSPGANVNGQISILGTASDESGLLSTQYRIGNKGDLSEGWITFANRFNWNTGSIFINQFATSDFADEILPGVWELAILIRTTDSAGNVTLIEDYFLEVDPEGDRPFAQILQPGDGETVGGRVRLSGTSNDDDAVIQVEVAFDMNNDGLFNGPGDIWPTPEGGWPAGQEPFLLNQVPNPVSSGQTFEDSSTTAWYRVNASTADWSNWFINLNTYGEFDPEPGQTRTIGVKVRAVDTKDGSTPGIAGNPVILTLTFDSNAPRIEELNYQTGDVVGGTITFTGLVKDPTGLESFRWIRGASSNFLLNNGVILQPDRIQLVGSGDPDYELGIQTYRFAIPVDTTTITTTSGPAFFTFEAAKGNYISQSFVNLQVDNLAPTGSIDPFLPTIQVGSTNYSLVSGLNYELRGTAIDTGSVSGINSVVVFLLDANGRARDLRTNFYGGQTELDRGSAIEPLPASSMVAGTRYVIVEPGDTNFVALGAHRNQTGAVFTALGSGTGTGTVLPENYFTIIDRYNEDYDDGIIGKGDQDGFDENLSFGMGGQVNWRWRFDSNLIPDGQVAITFAVTDVGGNITVSQVEGFVANNRPVIDSITLGTDLTGNGLTDGANERRTFTNGYLTTGFTVRNNRLFYQVQGPVGNGISTNGYILEYWNGTSFVPVITGDTGSGTLENFTTPEMPIPDTIVTGTEPQNQARFRVRVVDTLGLSTAQEIRLNIDNVDDIRPRARLFQLAATDFHTDGSNIKRGHVEPWNESPFNNTDPGFDKENEILGNDADVSGQIYFTGEAYDNQRLIALYMNIDLNGDGDFNGTVGGILERQQVAIVDGASGLLIPQGNTLGSLEITAQSLSQEEGHSVSFRFLWNSRSVQGIARANIGVMVEAEDTNNLSLEEQLRTLGTGANTDDFNRFQVDVVPYIRSIETSVGFSNPNNPTVYSRSALGRYPVWRSLTGSAQYETLNVRGFNLAPNGTNRVLVSKTPNGLNAGLNGFAADGQLINPDRVTEILAHEHYQLSMQDIVNSGYLSFVTIADGVYIPSINNTNNNDLVTNQEPNNVNNNLLNNNRYLDVWDLRQLNFGDTRNVDMTIHQNNINWGMGYSDTLAGVSLNGAAPIALRESYTRYFDNKLEFNSAGQFFFVAQAADTFGPPTTFQNPSNFAFNFRAAPGNNWEYGNTTSSRKLFIESNWNGADLNKLDRVQWPDMSVVGNAATSHMYLTYYDSVQGLLKFRYNRLGTAALPAGFTGTTIEAGVNMLQVPFGDVGTVNWTQTYQAVTRFNNGTNNYDQGYIAIAGAGANSPFSAVGATTAGTVAVFWFDANESSLKMRYNTAPATAFSGYQEFANTDQPNPGTYRFRLRVDGTLVNGGNDIVFTMPNPTNGSTTARRFEMAYRLNQAISEQFGAYAEVNPVTQRIVVRSMQTGPGSSISIEAPSSGTSLLGQMGGVSPAVPGTGEPWVERTLDADFSGRYVSVHVDSNNAFHIAYQRTATGDLRYMKLDDVTSAPVPYTIDSFLQTGQFIDITTRIESRTRIGDSLTEDVEIPYISYFNISNADTRISAKIASLQVHPEDIGHGAINDFYTGLWEVSIVPARQVPRQFRVNVGNTDDGRLIVGYSGNLIEYATYKP